MGDFVKEVRELRPALVSAEELMTLTEAAKRLGLSTSAAGDLVYRGVLTRLIDRGEPNPRKAGRVLRSEVEAEIVRRRGRRDDGRLKRRGAVTTPG